MVYLCDDCVAAILTSDGNDNLRLVDLHILKNRNGERSRIEFEFYVQVSEFKETGQGPLDGED